MLKQKSNSKRIIILCVIGILAIIVSARYDIGIPCIFFELTGMYCPGCGTTRALFSLIRLSPYQAFRYNPLVITLLPLAIIYLIYKYLFKGKNKIPNWIWIVLLIVTILFGVLRNISFFSYLAPTIIN